MFSVSVLSFNCDFCGGELSLSVPGSFTRDVALGDICGECILGLESVAEVSGVDYEVLLSLVGALLGSGFSVFALGVDTV